MNAKEQAHAPYNFVPFHTKGSATGGRRAERVCLRYEDASQLPGHDRLDPELKTGEIHVTMTAETPVFISAGKEDGSFFRDVGGRLAIPGSSVRGMLRQNMQILGYGAVRPGEDIEDQHIFFRVVAARKDGTDGDLNAYYKAALGMPSGRPAPGSDPIPKNVSAGYLCCEQGSYRIRPTCTPVVRVSRGDPVLCRAHLDGGYAKLEPVSYTLQGSRLQSISRDRQGGGVLLYTGKPANAGRGPGVVYLFPVVDRDAAPVELSKEDILSYSADLEDRANPLKTQYDASLRAKYGISFWELPESGKSKPVFYVRHNGHIYFGMSAHPRIGYAHSLAEGLPEQDSRLADTAVPLDYPHAVLGFAGQELSYRSRVSVGDFPAQGGAREGDTVRLILGQPKPSWYPGYVTDGKHYNEDDISLRGFKLYWQKDAKLPPDKEGKDNDNVKSKMRPLPAGTVFRGVIRYKNLHPDELGLLLWALRLEDGCRQSLGMAKPYGFGRMRLEIEKLLEYDVQRLYAPDGLCAGPAQAPEGAVEQYIRRFDACICQRLHIKKPTAQKPSITSQGEIQDFFFMHRPLQGGENTDYLDLDAQEYRHLTVPLPTVQDIRKKQEAKAAQAAPAGEVSMDDMLAALMKKNKPL